MTAAARGHSYSVSLPTMRIVFVLALLLISVRLCHGRRRGSTVGWLHHHLGALWERPETTAGEPTEVLAKLKRPVADGVTMHLKDKNNQQHRKHDDEHYPEHALYRQKRKIMKADGIVRPDAAKRQGSVKRGLEMQRERGISGEHADSDDHDKRGGGAISGHKEGNNDHATRVDGAITDPKEGRDDNDNRENEAVSDPKEGRNDHENRGDGAISDPKESRDDHDNRGDGAMSDHKEGSDYQSKRGDGAISDYKDGSDVYDVQIETRDQQRPGKAIADHDTGVGGLRQHPSNAILDSRSDQFIPGHGSAGDADSRDAPRPVVSERPEHHYGMLGKVFDLVKNNELIANNPIMKQLEQSRNYARILPALLGVSQRMEQDGEAKCLKPEEVAMVNDAVEYRKNAVPISNNEGLFHMFAQSVNAAQAATLSQEIATMTVASKASEELIDTNIATLSATPPCSS